MVIESNEWLPEGKSDIMKIVLIARSYLLMKFVPSLICNMNETVQSEQSLILNEVFFLCRSLLQPEMDLKWVISEEERTRHDALFYSQKPQDRYLSGER